METDFALLGYDNKQANLPVNIKNDLINVFGNINTENYSNNSNIINPFLTTNLKTQAEAQQYCDYESYGSGLDGDFGITEDAMFAGVDSIEQLGVGKLELYINRSKDIVYETSKLEEIKPRLTYISHNKQNDEATVYALSMPDNYKNVNLDLYTEEQVCFIGICGDYKWRQKVNDSTLLTPAASAIITKTEPVLNLELLIDYKDKNNNALKWDIAKLSDLNNQNGRFKVKIDSFSKKVNINNGTDKLCSKNKLLDTITVLYYSSSLRSFGNVTKNGEDKYPISPNHTMQLWGQDHCATLADINQTIIDPIEVRGGNEFAGFDKNKRNVQFNIFSGNQNVLNDNFVKYDGKSKVWIVTHGWKDDVGGFVNSYVNELKAKYPNDVILTLDWSNLAKQTAIGEIACPTNAPTWINPIANKVTDILINVWGYNTANNSTLNLIGHSLGTIMVSQISQRMGGANSTILLSPPGYCPFTNEYFLEPNNAKFNSYKDKSKFSIAFVQQETLADQFPLGNTADHVVSMNALDIQVDLGGIAGKHNFNPFAVSKLLFDDESKNINSRYRIGNIIGGRNLLSSNKYNFGFGGNVYNSFSHIDSYGTSPNATTNSIYLKVDNNTNIATNYITYVYGTDGNNNIMTEANNKRKSNLDYNYFGGNGNDTFYDNTDLNNITIKDFGNNGNRDRLSLSNTIKVSPNGQEFTGKFSLSARNDSFYYTPEINGEYVTEIRVNPFTGVEYATTKSIKIKLEGDGGYVERNIDQTKLNNGGGAVIKR